MEINDSDIYALKTFWEKQGISSLSKPMSEINNFSYGENIYLPEDFIEYFSILNGMESLYPNEFDNEGFLFYPFQGLITSAQEFDCPIDKNILIIANYMHKSWWYGLKVINQNEYTIGIIPEKNKFKHLANSLREFIKMYMNNSPELYNYM